MKALILSDLHLEFREDYSHFIFNALPSADEIDVCLLAGDITASSKIYSVMKDFSYKYNYKKVIYVPGNHEYYNSSPDEIREILIKVEKDFKNISVLTNKMVQVGNTRFLGTTLWFPETTFGKEYMNDFFSIMDFEPWVYRQNALAIRFLENNLNKGDVVITHHLPTEKSIAPQYARSVLNHFFCCDIEYLIHSKKPSIWLHGHTHTSFDYIIDDTRILCNPYGYLGYETNKYCKLDRIIDI